MTMWFCLRQLIAAALFAAAPGAAFSADEWQAQVGEALGKTGTPTPSGIYRVGLRRVLCRRPAACHSLEGSGPRVILPRAGDPGDERGREAHHRERVTAPPPAAGEADQGQGDEVRHHMGGRLLVVVRNADGLV